jgi:hypothetical protein
MPLVRVEYEFTVRLPAPRAEAYRWATDYRSDDFDRVGLPARRTVRPLGPGLVLLTDSFSADPFAAQRGARTTKRKLVHLYPRRFRWVSTHVAGPARHSQFVYELLPAGRSACRLRFTGAQVESYARRPSPAALRRRARELRKEDSGLWRRLVRSFAADRVRSRRARAVD